MLSNIILRSTAAFGGAPFLLKKCTAVNQWSGTVNDDKLLIGSVNTCVAVRPFSCTACLIQNNLKLFDYES